MSPFTKAALLSVAAGFIFNLETTVVKAIEGVPLATLVLARALGQLGWTLPALLRDPTLPRTRALPMQIFRGMLSVVSWYTYYLAFSGLPLATATVLSFTSVLFVTALAGPVLGERVRWRRWSATLVGFAGVIAIVRPGGAGAVALDWPLAAALASALMGAVIVLTTKTLARTERTGTIMFWIGVVAVSVALPVALPGLAWPGWGNLGLLLLCAVCGPFAMHLWINALRMVDASVVAPISYVRLVFAAATGVLLFNEVPDAWLGFGAALIVGSALYITRREAQVARRRAAPLAANAEAALPIQPVKPQADSAASSGPGSSPNSR
ncbi:DMT family transporter [Falsiroseomonas sp.]|uniref:DMT family transporter n=1 Tax=Falsiroseomonas sp. TaxID=2870721 RepID=UPI00271D1998|nr:DMT family transporter [Falsiroseomonas sp.]MDO9502071.1 DMT family transporter [Falsiroseomonas sp.]